MTGNQGQEPMSGTARYEHTATRWVSNHNRGDNTKYRSKK